MPCVLVPLADGFEEIEAVSIIDILRRADIEVLVAGLADILVTGSHGITLSADCLLDDALARNFDLIALPGGLPGAEHLKNDVRLRDKLITHADSGKPLAAICAAPMVLDNAGLIKGAATSYPSFLNPDSIDYREAPVVSDAGVTTSRGPATAMRFALQLVEQLVGMEKREELEDKMLVKVHGAN